MPNNIAGRGLTDREMIQLCLELEKGRCRGISHTLLETANPPLREIYQQCFENASTNQFQLFEILNNKGWYKTELATKDQISYVQALMQNNLNPNDQF